MQWYAHRFPCYEVEEESEGLVLVHDGFLRRSVWIERLDGRVAVEWDMNWEWYETYRNSGRVDIFRGDDFARILNERVFK